ncbi:hypothetical protein TraAM80_04085 [Trypanosoma rangeli]|uniref:Uncharacterized protein n=1 Tax=Trypanosoma rangeli TaxID=5698 RepID=A0A422NL96_TRYRA|nr:uncharacterized protein TraAM80_04085 [Trypanosoma rangeli]RNF06194.1 hypothetical protein TraAM80_04085 [Trypanosoma rangeli]|eukprot:RNF06194.1 hypothetical protein TraAM80_04085 [Trypanosoma rangeli]
MESEDAWRCHSLQLLELFIDLIHGDLVRKDAGCCRVADAFVAAYEDAIRWLVTKEQTFTSGLRGAINTYCARHVLRTAPELLITSETAAMSFKRIADILCETEELSHVGKAMAHELSHLARRLETKRFARLLDLMGDAVVEYMRQAVQQHEVEWAVCLTLREEPAFWACVKQFSTAPTRMEGETVAVHRKRPREEVELVDHNAGSREAPLHGFSEELRLAMSSPVRVSPASAVGTRFIACVQPKSSPPNVTWTEEGKRGKESVKATGRALLRTNDSVLATVEDMERKESQTAQEVDSSFIVADDSKGSIVPSLAAVCKGVTVAGDFNESDASLLRGEVYERRYFLCAKTNRYEPEGARGFFT